MSPKPEIKQSMSPRSHHVGNRLPATPVKRTKEPEVAKELMKPKAWSPTYSSPDFQALIDLENRKMVDGGFDRETPRVVSPMKNYKSMPSLTDADVKDGSIAEMSLQEKGKGKSSLKIEPSN